MEIIKEWVVKSEAETAAAAMDFKELLSPGTCVGLIGDLGAGKTTFVRYLARQYGVEGVNSPTFAIVNVYDGKNPIYHFDFYRLTSEAEFFEIGYYEYLEDKSALMLIEWADMFPAVLPDGCLKLNFRLDEDGTRTIKLTKE